MMNTFGEHFILPDEEYTDSDIGLPDNAVSADSLTENTSDHTDTQNNEYDPLTDPDCPDPMKDPQGFLNFVGQSGKFFY